MSEYELISAESICGGAVISAVYADSLGWRVVQCYPTDSAPDDVLAAAWNTHRAWTRPEKSEVMR